MLTEEATDASVSEIRNDLLRCIPDADIYFPALSLHGTIAWDHAMSGYVFVGTLTGAGVNRLQRSRFVMETVKTADRKNFALLDERQMQEIRRKVRPPALRKGSNVRILAGECQGLSGRVSKLVVAHNRVDVRIQLHSRHFVVSVSRHEVERV